MEGYYFVTPVRAQNQILKGIIDDAETYYKPCKMDVTHNAFVTRNILIRYTGEEASMRDSCCWRIEVPYELLDDTSLVFNVDLYSQKPIKNDNRVIAYSEKETLIGSQQMTVYSLSSDSYLNYVRLIFPQQGLCELKGVLICSLVDFRYQQQCLDYTPADDNDDDDDLDIEPMTFNEFLFNTCKTSLEVETKYKKMCTKLYQCLESSYYHIINCIQLIIQQYATVEIMKDSQLSIFLPFEIPKERYPFILISTQLLSQQLTAQTPVSPQHKSSLSCSQLSHHVQITPTDTIQSTMAASACCGSPRLSLTTKPLPNLNESLSCHEYDFDFNTIISPSKADEDSYSDFISEPCPIEPEISDGYSETNEIEERNNNTNDNDNDNDNDMMMTGLFFANKLAVGINECSAQLWNIYDSLVLIIKKCIGIIIEKMNDEHMVMLNEFYNRFVLISNLNRMDLSGEAINSLKDHKIMFDTVHHSSYYKDFSQYESINNDTLLTYALQSEKRYHFPLVLLDKYNNEHLEKVKKETEEWRCYNEACKRWCVKGVKRCPYCLMPRKKEKLHIVFLLHGFRAQPSDLHHISDHLHLKHPSLKTYLLHSCYDNTSKSLMTLSSLIVQEIVTILNKLKAAHRTIGRISFIGHSIGALVLRLAIQNPLLSQYTSRYHLFLSLNAPHLGVLFMKKTLEWGSKVVSILQSSELVDELLLRDNKNPRNTLLYKMALSCGMSQFKYFYLFSSCQDSFVPFHSERAESTPAILEADSLEAEVYQEMVTAFWRDLKESSCKTIVKKFDVCYDNINFSLESIIGKTAHNNILTDINVIEILLCKMEECFAEDE